MKLRLVADGGAGKKILVGLEQLSSRCLALCDSGSHQLTVHTIAFQGIAVVGVDFTVENAGGGIGSGVGSFEKMGGAVVMDVVFVEPERRRSRGRLGACTVAVQHVDLNQRRRGGQWGDTARVHGFVAVFSRHFRRACEGQEGEQAKEKGGHFGLDLIGCQNK